MSLLRDEYLFVFYFHFVARLACLWWGPNSLSIGHKSLYPSFLTHFHLNQLIQSKAYKVIFMYFWYTASFKELSISFQFVAHPNCQQHMTSIWYGSEMGFLQSFSWVRESIYAILFLPAIPFLCAVYVLLPNSKVGYRHATWQIKAHWFYSSILVISMVMKH